jgi:hypothetical protein
MLFAAATCRVESIEEDFLPVYLFSAFLLFGCCFFGGLGFCLLLFVFFFRFDEVEERIIEQLLLEVLLEIEQRHVKKIHRLIKARVDLQLLPKLR